MSAKALTYAVELITEECCSCGTLFAIPSQLQRRLRETGATFYCPSGHGQCYGSRIKELEQRLVQATNDVSSARMDAAAERTKRQAVEAECERQKKRAHAGVCPCCHRTFNQLAAHMRNKHPEAGKQAEKFKP